MICAKCGLITLKQGTFLIKMIRAKCTSHRDISLSLVPSKNMEICPSQIYNLGLNAAT